MPRITLRDEFRPRIAAVLERTRGQPAAEIREELRSAFPLGVRKYWPYKVWLCEIRRQLGKRRQANASEPTPLFDQLEMEISL